MFTSIDTLEQLHKAVERNDVKKVRYILIERLVHITYSPVFQQSTFAVLNLKISQIYMEHHL